LDKGVRQLTEVRGTFERFAGGSIAKGALSALEVAQALTELQHPAPRTQILRHLKDRGYGVGKEIDFFEFLRAYSALVVEKDYAPSEGVRSSKRQA
jgi:hypothetical protein